MDCIYIFLYSLIGGANYIVLVEQVQSHYNFGPLCAYLSVNYLDRFLSAYELPVRILQIWLNYLVMLFGYLRWRIHFYGFGFVEG